MNNMTRRDCLKLGVLGASAFLWPHKLLAAAASQAAGVRKPNIVFILSDDIGYGDLGCYGATKVKTPNIDRLAARGLRFTSAYAPSAMCTPTRYGILTGLYAWRKNIGGALNGLAPISIKPGSVTLPSMLKRAGYATGIVGKWHLGLGEGQTDYNGEITPGPLEVGFDYFFGYPATNDRVPCVYIENRRVVDLDPNDPIAVRYGQPIGADPTGKDSGVTMKYPPRPGHDGTIVDGLSRIGYMSGGQKARWVDEDMADTLAAKATAFIQQHKDQPFFLYLPTHSIHAPHLPNKRFVGTSQCGIRGDSIHELDWTVGQVLEALDKAGLTQDTLVIFSSDNGGALADGYDDGSEANANGHEPNGPLRGGKYGLYEGGTRTPLITYWPGKIAPGKSDDMVCLVDLLASMAAMTGQDVPADSAIDSINVLPSLLGTAKQPARDHVVIHQGGGPRLAIRKGPWKLIPAAPPRATQSQPATKKATTKAAPRVPSEVELFNLDQDLGETNNVAAANPQIVAELTALLVEVRRKTTR